MAASFAAINSVFDIKAPKQSTEGRRARWYKDFISWVPGLFKHASISG